MTQDTAATANPAPSDILPLKLPRRLWLWILIGLVTGLGTGLILSPDAGGVLNADQAAPVGEWLALPGVIFLGLIQMVIIPLIFSSIILGICQSGELSFLRQIGLRLVPYFILTTIVAVVIGITISTVINPGSMIDSADMQNTLHIAEQQAANLQQKTLDDLTVPQRIVNMLPVNLAEASLHRDMLKIVIAALMFGVAILSMPARTARPLIEISESVQALTMQIIGWAMTIAPLAVFGFLADITTRTGKDVLVGMGGYVITILLGLACIMVFYMIMVRFVAGRSVLDFMRGIREAQLLAFSSSSSAATMPVSMLVAERNLGIRPSVTQVVIPLGATINMDGTAMYQAAAAIFLTQVFGVDLSLGETVLLVLTTVGASIGTPAIPGVGIVVLATILTGIGVPPAGVGLILGVDRILDMCRTVVNISGDLTACTVMDRWVPRKKP